MGSFMGTTFFTERSLHEVVLGNRSDVSMWYVVIKTLLNIPSLPELINWNAPLYQIVLCSREAASDMYSCLTFISRLADGKERGLSLSKLVFSSTGTVFSK